MEAFDFTPYLHACFIRHQSNLGSSLVMLSLCGALMWRRASRDVLHSAADPGGGGQEGHRGLCHPAAAHQRAGLLPGHQRHHAGVQPMANTGPRGPLDPTLLFTLKPCVGAQPLWFSPSAPRAAAAGFTGVGSMWFHLLGSMLGSA